MSLYPNSLDSDLELSRVEDNTTEISSDAIANIRDAVIAIEKALGIDIQGNKNDLVSRLAISIDQNGKLRASALSDAGLIALPINNSMIGDTAGILESKLDLDYSTQSLHNSISSLQTTTNGLTSGLTSSSGRFNSHVLGTGEYHDGYQIKINRTTGNGVAGVSGLTVGDVVNEIATLLLAGDSTTTPHIDLNLPSTVKHLAESLSINQSTTYEVLDMSSYDMQSVVENIDYNLKRQQEKHVDGFHSNGIFRNINAGDYYSATQERLASTSGVTYTEGTSIITIPGVSSFSDLYIYSGSIIEIENGIDAGTYQILETGALTAAQTLGDIPALTATQLLINHVFVDTAVSGDGISASIYDAASVSSNLAPLACAVKNNVTLVDSVAILNPNAARVVSLGFNGDILGVDSDDNELGSDGYSINIEAGLDDSMVRGLTITHLNRNRLGTHAVAVSAKTVAERINAFVSDPTLGHHFPITAFEVGNELIISHNLVGSQYTLEILGGYTGNYALGLDENGADILDRVIYGNNNNTYSVNGVSLNTLKTIFSGTSTLSVASTTIPLYDSNGKLVDPTLLGIQSGDILHITKHSNLDTNGSYTIASVSTTAVSVFAAETVAIDSSFNVSITSSFVSLEDLQSGSETNKGLAIIYVDEDGYTLAKQRAQYPAIGNNVEIIDVSSNFPVDDVTVAITASEDQRLFNIIYDTVAGVTKSVHRYFAGTFSLYHPNNIDYLTIKCADGDITTASETLTVYRTLNEDEAMPLSIVHFDGSTGITNLIDKRQFGNVAADQIRDDFIELYSERPVSELRSDGVVRGFDLMDLSYSDGNSGMHALPLRGGVAYIDGVRCEVETQKVVLQSYNSALTELDGYKVVGINKYGTVKAFSDELGEILSDGYSSDPQFGKILPLYQVTLLNGLPYQVTDLRFFINDIDTKLELIVDATNNRTGNFNSLEGALLYAENYPNAEKLTIRLMDSVTVRAPLRVPDGVSIIGGAAYGGSGNRSDTENSRGYRVTNDRDLNSPLFILDGYNRIENIEIASANKNMDGALISIQGNNIVINNCLIHFTDLESLASNNLDIGIEVGQSASDHITITNNEITNVYSGILAVHGCNNIEISGNTISHIKGSATEAYGILLGTSTRSIESAKINNNKIDIPSVASSDIRGINVDVDEPINYLCIEHNEISHSKGDTLTNGIRIENLASSGETIQKLIIDHNSINGVKSASNDVWGIWVTNADIAHIHHNIIQNVGIAGYTDLGFIGVDENVTYIDIEHNTLQTGAGSATNYGIYKTTTDSTAEKCRIADNTISNISSVACGIYGTTPRSVIDGNILDGPCGTGIYWTGQYSKICDNSISDPAGTSSCADYGIYTDANDLDICNNAINDLSSGSVGIITNSGNDRIKMIGNTLYGTQINSFISLYGDNHLVSKNKLYNVLDNTTSFITLYTVTGSLIDGNIMVATTSATNGVLESGTGPDNVTFSNNILIGTVTNGFNIATAADCSFVGNTTPDASTNTIGPTPATATINKNLIGHNRGYADTMGISMAEGVSSGDSEWTLNSTDDSWSPAASGSAYYLYFPLNKIPNGARLVSVEVSGVESASGGDLTLDIFRKSMKSTFAIDAISTAAITISSDDGSTFGPSKTPDGLITADTTGNVNVINYEESNYYVRIATDSNDCTDTKIHGITINFRY